MRGVDFIDTLLRVVEVGGGVRCGRSEGRQAARSHARPRLHTKERSQRLEPGMMEGGREAAL